MRNMGRCDRCGKLVMADRDLADVKIAFPHRDGLEDVSLGWDACQQCVDEVHHFMAVTSPTSTPKGKPEPWIYDERCGMAAVYVGKRRNCLETGEPMIYTVHFPKDGRGDYVPDESVCDAMRGLVEAHNAAIGEKPCDSKA